ncbi:diol dehydratase small subunit [Cetobacterium sp.]|uniref:diol dehydratase small subunit n=1 Tax=Cetobacterium sp. TaxID=2071632 RepID=UPI003AEF4A90
MDQQSLEKMIREMMMSLLKEEQEVLKPVDINFSKKSLCAENYPLSEKMTDIVKSATNKKLDEFTIENVMLGNINAADCRISAETLEMQAQIAESVNREAFAKNLRRAAELTKVPDERILEIYNSLRPYRSTKEELLNIAKELEEKYCAVVNSQLIKEAAELYEKRGKLRID